jgi:hypothetical protein
MRTKKRWMPVPPKPVRPKPPVNLKLEVQRKADEFVESYLETDLHSHATQRPSVELRGGHPHEMVSKIFLLWIDIPVSKPKLHLRVFRIEICEAGVCW